MIVLVVNDLGVTLDIGDFAPKLFNSMLQRSWERRSEKILAQETGDPELSGKRACMAEARKFMRKKANPADQKKAVGAAASNAIWTRTRLKEAGYLVESTLCELCGAGEDTRVSARTNHDA